MTKNSSNHLNSIHKLNESLRKSIYPTVTTPFYDSQLQLRQEYDDYISEIKAYKATAFNLNDKELNDILLSIANGKNSFNDLCTVIDGLNSATIMKYLLDKPKMRVNSPTGLNLLGDNIISPPNQKVYLQLHSIPDDFYAPYEFKPDEKDSRNKSLDIANQSLKSSKIANTLSVVAIILAIISIFISILFKFF